MPKTIAKKSSKPVGRSNRKKGSDFDFNPTTVTRKLSAQDPALGKLIKKVGPFTLKLAPIDSPFHALAESIVYQQLHGKAAATIFGRVMALFDSPKFLSPHHISSISDTKLRATGLSRSKLASMKDLADKAIEGLVPKPKDLHKLTDDEIVERLTTIRGIGRWTVEMMLIFRMGRPDVLPINDYGLRKGFAILVGSEDLPTPKEFEAYGERWRPYRTVASWYLWRIHDLNKNLNKN